MWVVVPVKRLDLAKRRLDPTLDAAERGAFARAMLRDVVEASRQAPGIAATLVVTLDPDAAEIARASGAEVCPERVADESSDPDSALNLALDTAARWIRSRRGESLAVLPADLPLASPHEIHQLATAVDLEPGPAIALVRDRHRTGTNALAMRPVDVLPFSFGPNSAERHRRLAQKRGIVTHELDLPSLRLDIDSVEDLGELYQRSSNCHAQSFLDSLDRRRIDVMLEAVSSGDPRNASLDNHPMASDIAESNREPRSQPR